MGNRSSVSVAELTPPLAQDADANLSAAALPQPHDHPTSPGPLPKRLSISTSAIERTPRVVDLPLGIRPDSALSLTMTSTAFDAPYPSSSSPKKPPPLRTDDFAAVVERQFAKNNPSRRASLTPVRGLSGTPSRRKSLSSYKNRVAPEELMSTPAQRQAERYRAESRSASPAASPPRSVRSSPKSSARASPIDSPDISVRGLRDRLNPLHHSAFPTPRDHALPLPSPSPTHPIPASLSSFLDAFPLSALCHPSEAVLSSLWSHYQSAHPHLELLPFTALNRFSHDLTLRVLADHAGRGTDVEGEEGREAVLPGWEHGSVEASAVCVMREVARRMGTRVDRGVWDATLGATVYGVWTRKEREQARKDKLRRRAGAQRRPSQQRSSPTWCTVM